MKRQRTTPKEFEFDMTTFHHIPVMLAIRISSPEVSNMMQTSSTRDAIMEDEKEEEKEH